MAFDALMSIMPDALQQQLLASPLRTRRTAPTLLSPFMAQAAGAAPRTERESAPRKTSAMHHTAAAKATPTATPKQVQKPQSRQPGDAREGRTASARGDGNSMLDSPRSWLPILTMPDEQDQGEGEADTEDEQDGGSDQSQTPHQRHDASGGYDAELVLELLPTQGNSGIFEVLFPNGESMGVMVDIGTTTAAFILLPQEAALRDLLNSKQMELEGGLRRRMDKLVRLTVL